jgi:hypothetical protein
MQTADSNLDTAQMHNTTILALREFARAAVREVQIVCTVDTTTVHCADVNDAMKALDAYNKSGRHLNHLVDMGITDTFDIQVDPLPHVCTRKVPPPHTSLLFEAHKVTGPVKMRVGTEPEQHCLWISMQEQMRTEGHTGEPVRLDTLHKSTTDGRRFVMHAIFSSTQIRDLALEILSQAPLSLTMRLDDIHSEHTCRPRAEALPMLVKRLLIEGTYTEKQPLQSQGAAQK